VVAGSPTEAYPLAMAKSDEGPVESRTYSVEEVGAIIRRATTEKTAPAAPPLEGHDRVGWSDLVEIAGDLDISETALRRAVTPAPPVPPKARAPEPAAPRPAAAAPADTDVDPGPAAASPGTAVARADDLAVEKRRFFHRAAQSALTLAFLGALDLVIGTHGVIFTIGALAIGLGLGRRAIRLWLGAPPPRAVLTDGGHTDWRELKRAAHHARRAERHAWKAERHARRAERYKL
jgi:hypothetical protein